MLQAAELAEAMGQPATGEDDAGVPNLVAPIFAVSSVSGAQLPALHAFLSRLSPTVAEGQLGRGSTPTEQGSSSDSGETCSLGEWLPGMCCCRWQVPASISLRMWCM